MIDRLMHHGEAILIQGESYRTKDGTEEELVNLARQQLERRQTPQKQDAKNWADVCANSSDRREHQTRTR